MKVFTSLGNHVQLDPDLAELLAGRAINENQGRVVVTLSLGDLVLMLSGARREDGDTVDHINRDMYDNRLENLRYADKQTQSINRRVATHHAGKPKLSKYRGVTAKRGKWYGQIRHDKQLYRSPPFTTEREAAAWYNEQALMLRGEDAHINIL